MRFTIASIAIMAGAVAAGPQYGVQPINQIPDGQIQATPAYTVVGTPVPVPSPTGDSVSAGPSSLVSLPSSINSTLAVTQTASVTSVVVVPTATPIVPTATATPIAPTGSLVTPIVGGNSTASATGTASVSTASPKESATSRPPNSSTAKPSAPESTGAAAGNMVSFAGLVLAIGAALFA